jgi:hypothetical protein
MANRDSNGSNVISMPPPGPPDGRSTDGIPRPILKALREHEHRVYQARAIIELAILKLDDVQQSCGADANECASLSQALAGAVGILTPVDNLTDAIALMRRGKELLGPEVDNG